MINLELRFDYPDGNTAAAILAATAPDNEGYVKSEIQDSTVVFRLEAGSAGTMKNTADDLLACIKTAEDAADLASNRRI